MRLLKYFTAIILIFSILYGVDDIDQQNYKQSTYEQLHEKFSFISNTESMECDSMINPHKCEFKVSRDYNLLSIIFILFISFIIMIGLIGTNPEGIGFSETIIYDTELSKKRQDEINHRPLQIGKAIIVFIIALYIIKYINSGYYNKNFDFHEKKFYLTDSKTDEIEKSFAFSKIKNIEILKYTDNTYEHYELNLHLTDDERIHIFARKDYLSPTIYAKVLADKLDIPIKKVVSTF